MSDVKTHELKTWPVVFQAIVDGSKTFEFRKNDRNFKSGDVLTLAEWNPTEKEYTGRTETFTVGYVAKGAWGIPDGYCVFSLLRADNARLKSRVEGYEKQWTDMNFTIGKCLDQLATYKAAVVEAREALREWLKFTSITPVFPLNDWFNRREELVAKTTPLLSESALHTLSALTGDATKPT